MEDDDVPLWGRKVNTTLVLVQIILFLGSILLTKTSSLPKVYVLGQLKKSQGIIQIVLMAVFVYYWFSRLRRKNQFAIMHGR